MFWRIINREPTILYPSPPLQDDVIAPTTSRSLCPHFLD